MSFTLMQEIANFISRKRHLCWFKISSAWRIPLHKLWIFKLACIKGGFMMWSKNINYYYCLFIFNFINYYKILFHVYLIVILNWKCWQNDCIFDIEIKTDDLLRILISNYPFYRIISPSSTLLIIIMLRNMYS